MKIIYQIILITAIIKQSFSLITKLHTIPSKNYLSLRSLEQSTSYGNSHDLNYYYSYLYVGKPPKPQSYILDTGSSITTSPCSLCNSCGTHQNGLYEISKDQILKCSNKSCSYVNNKCSISDSDCSFYISYSEGSSISGVYVNEFINFGNYYEEKESFEFPIGCTNRETHLFVTQLADGIMGLQNNNKGFVSILYLLGQIKNHIFSLCFALDGGFFSIGEIQYKSHLSDIQYLNLTNDSFYKINLKFIEINDIVFEVNGENDYQKYTTFIDSGTTISYFPRNFFDSINQLFQELCENNKCGKYSVDSELGSCLTFNNETHMNYVLDNILPNITFKFNDLDYIWEPRDYYFDNSHSNIIQICLGFSYGSKFTLGSTWMRNHDIIFDRENLKVGFARANCSYINLKDRNDEKIYNNNSNINDVKETEENREEEDINEIDDKDKKGNEDNNNDIKEYNNNLNDKIMNKKFKIFIATIFFITIILCVINYIIRNKFCFKTKKYNQAIEEVANTNKSSNEENNKMHDKEKTKTLEIIEIVKQ